jgi:hypothetical protein
MSSGSLAVSDGSLNDVIVLDEQHLRRVLHSYVAYYHTWRPHRSLEMDAPEPRAVQPPELGLIRKRPEVGGFHHHDERIAAPSFNRLQSQPG